MDEVRAHNMAPVLGVLLGPQGVVLVERMILTAKLAEPVGVVEPAVLGRNVERKAIAREIVAVGHGVWLLDRMGGKLASSAIGYGRKGGSEASSCLRPQ